VFALRAGLEQLLACLDTVLDSLVIAGLEMQRIEVSVTAPVAPVKRCRALEENGCSDRLVMLFRLDDEDIVR
jgi:hypothetical protein